MRREPRQLVRAAPPPTAWTFCYNDLRGRERCCVVSLALAVWVPPGPGPMRYATPDRAEALRGADPLLPSIQAGGTGSIPPVPGL
jgi:hypothetical protein